MRLGHLAANTKRVGVQQLLQLVYNVFMQNCPRGYFFDEFNQVSSILQVDAAQKVAIEIVQWLLSLAGLFFEILAQTSEKLVFCSTDVGVVIFLYDDYIGFTMGSYIFSYTALILTLGVIFEIYDIFFLIRYCINSNLGCNL